MCGPLPPGASAIACLLVDRLGVLTHFPLSRRNLALSFEELSFLQTQST